MHHRQKRSAYLYSYIFQSNLYGVLFLVVLCAAIFISAILVSFFSQREKEILVENKTATLNQTVVYASQMMEQLQTVADSVWISQEIQTLIASGKREENRMLYRRAMDYLSGIQASFPLIYQLDVYLSESDVLVTANNGVFYQTEPDLKNYLLNKQTESLGYLWENDYHTKTPGYWKRTSNSVTLFRPLYHTANGEKNGLICITVLCNSFRDLIDIEELGIEGYAVVDKSGAVLTESCHEEIQTDFLQAVRGNETTLGHFRSGSKECQLVCTTEEITGWTFSIAFEEEISFWEQTSLIVSAASIIVLLGISFLVIIFIFRRRVVVPIELLVNAMERIKGGTFGQQLPEGRKDIFGYIFIQFNRMSSQIETLIEKTVCQQVQIRDEQTKLLQAQINPHFLYNIFNNIIWLAEQKKSEEIEQLTSAAAGYYRTCLNSGRDTICVSDCIRQLQYYVQIQQFRFGDQFAFELCIEDDMMNAAIPHMLLQPLVENAFVHGIKNRRSQLLHITVTGQRQKEWLEFYIQDNGNGMSAERLTQVRRVLAGELPEKNDCFALANIARRLNMYQPDARFEIESSLSEGTTVHLVFKEVMR